MSLWNPFESSGSNISEQLGGGFEILQVTQENHFLDGEICPFYTGCPLVGNEGMNPENIPVPSHGAFGFVFRVTSLLGGSPWLASS